MIIISALNCGVYSRTVFLSNKYGNHFIYCTGDHGTVLAIIKFAKTLNSIFDCCRLNPYGVALLFNKHRCCDHSCETSLQTFKFENQTCRVRGLR